MPTPFAKVFDTPLTQVLCYLTSDENGAPKVNRILELEGFGQICLNACYNQDNEEAWAKAEAYFESIDQAHAEKIVAAAIKLTEDGKHPSLEPDERMTDG